VSDKPIGYGNWTAGYLCEDTSANLTVAFGEPFAAQSPAQRRQAARDALYRAGIRPNRWKRLAWSTLNAAANLAILAWMTDWFASSHHVVAFGGVLSWAGISLIEAKRDFFDEAK
jgi:hypothetical protein